MSTPNKKLTDSQIQQDRTNTIMNIVAERASYYRANPHRFAEEFLGIQLKLFQKILLYAMMVYDNFFFIAARGQHIGNRRKYGFYARTKGLYISKLL